MDTSHRAGCTGPRAICSPCKSPGGHEGALSSAGSGQEQGLGMLARDSPSLSTSRPHTRTPQGLLRQVEAGWQPHARWAPYPSRPGSLASPSLLIRRLRNGAHRHAAHSRSHTNTHAHNTLVHPHTRADTMWHSAHKSPRPHILHLSASSGVEAERASPATASGRLWFLPLLCTASPPGFWHCVQSPGSRAAIPWLTLWVPTGPSSKGPGRGESD